MREVSRPEGAADTSRAMGKRKPDVIRASKRNVGVIYFIAFGPVARRR